MSNEKQDIGVVALAEHKARQKVKSVPVRGQDLGDCLFLYATPAKEHTIVIEPTFRPGMLDEHGFPVPERKTIDASYLVALDAVSETFPPHYQL